MVDKGEVASLKSLDAGNDLKRIGNRIKQLRRKLGYTSYEKFANEHDIHRVQWGRYEQGLDMYASTLIKITRLLRVSLKDFFSEGFD
jgi:transcriptional regulator with XRE-family HTH domain